MNAGIASVTQRSFLSLPLTMHGLLGTLKRRNRPARYGRRLILVTQGRLHASPRSFSPHPRDMRSRLKRLRRDLNSILTLRLDISFLLRAIRILIVMARPKTYCDKDQNVDWRLLRP